MGKQPPSSFLKAPFILSIEYLRPVDSYIVAKTKNLAMQLSYDIKIQEIHDD